MAEPEPLITVTRKQQEDLDPVLGAAFLIGGKPLGDMIMAAYTIGRRHGEHDRLRMAGGTR